MPASRNEIASDAPSRPIEQRLALDRAADRVAQREHERVAARDDRRAPLERAQDLDVGQIGDLAQDLVGVLAGQVADVDVHAAAVGDLVEARRRP